MEEIEIVESKAYRLIEPGKFAETTLKHRFSEGQVVVKPRLVSVCQADLRYFTGQRRKDALMKKLPMALFHEGIGDVVISNDDSVLAGERVVIVPNIRGELLNGRNKDRSQSPQRNVADNYADDSVFLGSGFDGLGQSHLVLPAENVIPIPKNIPDNIAVLTELNSVSFHALQRVTDTLHQGKVAVFGDGPVGYLTAAMLRHIYHTSKSQLLVFGAIPEKLAHFDFATTHLVQEYEFYKRNDITTVIECTGGVFSESAINQAIDLIAPQGRIVLLGVSEDKVAINTRDVLEKGLILYGSSRSSINDFKSLIVPFQNKMYQQTLSKLLPEKNVCIRNVDELQNVMTKISKSKGWKKTILAFEW